MILWCLPLSHIRSVLVHIHEADHIFRLWLTHHIHFHRVLLIIELADGTAHLVDYLRLFVLIVLLVELVRV